MNLIKYITLILIGFCSGIVISGAVFAFIAIIGLVPRLAKRTNTTKHIRLYEQAIILGGIFGTSTLIFNYYIPLSNFIIIFLALCSGIFIGSLAISLAEILDVVPILSRRARIQSGMQYFVLAIAIGKFIGSIIYFYYPGFYQI